ncbi:MAG: polymer-forming cytoskeletal protein [Defluviitaleaceae bacterium]|nr:polymer-forming cytoskeletal protein [Defluviitaleaceae bacterium]
MSRNKPQDEFTKPTGTVIGNGFTIHTARFTCNDSEAMRIDGTIIGDVIIEGVLNLSDTGRVDGNIFAGSTRIAGRVFGNVSCRNVLHLASTADVQGDIVTTTLIIDDGAMFSGTCQTNVNASDTLHDSSMITLS